MLLQARLVNYKSFPGCVLPMYVRLAYFSCVLSGIYRFGSFDDSFPTAVRHNCRCVPFLTHLSMKE